MTSAPALSPIHIVVVEDYEPLRRTAATILRRHGYRVSEARHARAAVEILSGHPPVDLILADLMLGTGSGHSICVLVRDRWPELPVILTTAGALPSDAARNWNDAIVLRKPYRAAALLASVAQALDRASARRHAAQRSVLGDR